MKVQIKGTEEGNQAVLGQVVIAKWRNWDTALAYNRLVEGAKDAAMKPLAMFTREGSRGVSCPHDG